MNEEAKQIILTNLYLEYFNMGGETDIHKIKEATEFDDNQYYLLVDHLEDDGFIKPYAMGGYYRLTAEGALMCEENGYVSQELIDQNRCIRARILLRLADLYDAQGKHYSIPDNEFTEPGENEDQQIDPNLQLLMDVGLIEPHYIGSHRITSRGLNAANLIRRNKNIEDNFGNISLLPPQTRGMEFQKLIAQVVSFSGWDQEEGVRTSNEEIDIIIHKEREYYLIECKWEANPIQTSVIDGLFSKMSKRSSTNGILFSMSGFTSGSETAVLQHESQRRILLFGKQSINIIISNPDEFERLLSEKIHSLVTRHIVDCS